MSYTYHALRRMKQRKLCKDEINRTVLEGACRITPNNRCLFILGSLVVVVSADDYVLTAYVGRASKIERLIGGES